MIMTLVIDCTTPEKLEAFGAALLRAASDGAIVDLGEVAKASGTLQTNIVAETAHYEIEDHGEDWEGYFTKRFGLNMKQSAKDDHILARWACADTMELLIPTMHSAEDFHMEQLEQRERIKRSGQ
jgi:hypothetical protein